MKLAGIPRAEVEVLGCLWQAGEMAVSQICERLRKHKAISHGATFALLKRLQRKGLVARRKGEVGKALLFRCTEHAKQLRGRIAGDVLARHFGGDRVAMTRLMLEEGIVDESEVQERLAQFTKG